MSSIPESSSPLRRDARRGWLLSALLLAAACGSKEPVPSGGPDAPEHVAERGSSEPFLPGAARGPGRPSIVLIVADTLRARSLSLYGNPRSTSPQLDTFAESATTFHRARATAPWTLPSHASLFTGLYPYQHGAHTYDPAVIQNDAANILPLDESFVTLAELLAAQGYRTGAFVANLGFLSPEFALDQGFDTYEVHQVPATDLNERALAWTAEGGEEPWFLFLNYMDVHRPYRCEPRPGFPDLGTPAESEELLERLRSQLLDEVVTPSPADLARLEGQYENAVANLDAGLGALFDGLRGQGTFDDLLIAVTSDHGEYFGEHGLIEHGKDLYEEVLGIPLIVKAPGQREPVADHEWISLVHVPGLILSQVEVTQRVPRWRALTRHWPREAIFAEKYHGHFVDADLTLAPRLQRKRKAAWRGDTKLIDSADGENELYDLLQDPEEAANLVDAQPERASELQELLRRVEPKPLRVKVGTRPSDESLEALRALGYLSDD